nr:glycosyltransferase [uncultured Desulfobacter sp.]
MARPRLVSVWCIAYNQEQYIAQAIESWLMQKTDFPIEIVIGEDCSTDNTRAIIDSYQAKYPDLIRVIGSENNVGMMANFVRTLEACKGDFIALCEGDDYWTDPLKLQKQFDFLTHAPEYSVCFHPVRVQVGEEVKDDFITQNVHETTTIYDLSKGNFIHTPSVMMRRNSKVINSIRDLNSPLGDYVLHTLNAQYGNIKKLPDCMANYRVHDGGIWSNKNTEFKLAKTVETIEILEGAVEKEFCSVFSIQKEQLLLSLLELSENNLEQLKLYSVKLIENNPAIILSLQMRLKKQAVSPAPSFMQKIKQCLLDVRVF